MKKILFTFWLLTLFIVMINQISCNQNPFKHGELLYKGLCQNCHQEDGQAVKGLIPPLAGSDYFKDNPALIACIMEHGLEGEIVVNGKKYNSPMAPIEDLSSSEMANIINFIINSWGNEGGFVSIKDVKSALESCKE